MYIADMRMCTADAVVKRMKAKMVRVRNTTTYLEARFQGIELLQLVHGALCAPPCALCAAPAGAALHPSLPAAPAYASQAKQTGVLSGV